MSFLTPLALALGALAIPILLLYMLRLRREEMPVSSTFLWQQLLRDREANAPWQRLRLSWLLLLQLLILAALVMALARPFTKVSTITTGRIVLLLDASASMKATDVSPNRFAAAREVALEIVDTLGSDDTMTVIRVADVPEVLAAASRDKVVLRRAIQSAEVGDISADWTAALTLAAAGGVGVDELKVVIVSDGGLPDNLPAVPGDVRFIPVGQESSNIAISALATSALPGRLPQLFISVSNYGDQDQPVIVSGYLNGGDVIEWAFNYTIPANGYRDITTIELPENFETLRVQLTTPSTATEPDYLAADNAAYTVRDRSGAGRVLLVTTDNLYLEQIFRSLPGVELFKLDPEARLTAEDDFDLVVLDGVVPVSLPDSDLLFVNPPLSTSFFTLGEAVQGVRVVTTHPEDLRARNLDPFVNSLNLVNYTRLENIPWATVLLSADGNALVAAGEVDDRQVAILPFDVRFPNTDLVLQPAWPILMDELVKWFSPPRVTDVTKSVPPGSPVRVRFSDGAEDAVITLPGGSQQVLQPRGTEAVFADTRHPGFYRVDLRKDGRTVRSEEFAVNLFDPRESRIAPEDSLRVGTVEVGRDARQETGRREFWHWIVVLGLLILMVEWWLYHRSVRRIPRAALAKPKSLAASRSQTALAVKSRWAALGQRLRRRRVRRPVRTTAKTR